MRQRRPMIALVAAAIIIPLSGVMSATAQAATPTSLRDPVKREIAQEIVTSAENSALDWYKRYSYIEDIKDDRGYTGGIIGFTSGTHDMLVLVQQYTDKYPGNPLAKWIPKLKQVDGTKNTGPLGSAYVKDWEAEGKKPEFQRAQRDLTRSMYFDPSMDLATSDKLGALGQFAYYDAAVVHGFDGMEDIRKAALKKAKTPAQGGNETTYLNAFLDERVKEMKKEAAHEDVSRIEKAQRVWLKAGNLNLDTPLKWSVYGDPYSIASDPTPHWPSSELGGTDSTPSPSPTPTPTPTPTPSPTTTPNPGAVLISQGRPVTASSVESTTYAVKLAVDGDAKSRWASKEGSDPQWIQVDLGTGATVSAATLSWEAAYAKKYRVEISSDGSNWSTLATENAGDGGSDQIAGLNGAGRYLRVYGTARGTAYGYSLYELQVYGTAGTPGGGNPDPGSGAFTVVAAGDIAGQCAKAASDCNHFATAALAQSIDPAFYITLGDNQYDDAHASDFASYYDKSWGRFKDKTYPIPGNHEKYDRDYDEHTDRGDEKAYRDYFGSRATPQGKTWYSFDRGNWHFIALNSNRWFDAEQMSWLDADLAANTKPCTVAYYHEPLFTTGEHGNTLSSKPAWSKLEAAGAELILNGHDHDYERFAPQTATGAASATGPVEIIAGLGGVNQRDLNDTPQKNSVKRINDTYGVLRLDLTDTTFTTKFVSIDGTVRDTSPTYTCH